MTDKDTKTPVGGYRFEYVVHPELKAPEYPTKVVVEGAVEASLTDLLELFKTFLKATGFEWKGHLDFVEEVDNDGN